MSVFMRAVLGAWRDPPFTDLRAACAAANLQLDGGGWAEWQVADAEGTVVLLGDVQVGGDKDEEIATLRADADDHDGTDDARAEVRERLGAAAAIVGMQVLMSEYDASVDAAHVVYDLLARDQPVLCQIDTIGWQRHGDDDLLLVEPE